MSIDSDNSQALVEDIKQSNSGTKPFVEEKVNDGFTVYLNQRKETKEEKVLVEGKDTQLTKTNVPEIVEINNDERPYTLDNIRKLRTPELSKYKNRASEEEVASYIEKMNIDRALDPRKEAIYNEALMYGTQSGLYARSYQLNKFLEANKKYYNKTFNFQQLMLHGGRVIPPVVVEAEDLFAQEDQYTLRTVNKSYKILEQAKVINTPLLWQKYFDYYIKKPELPDERLLPLNEFEDSYWEKGILEGWKVGVNQANSIFLESLKTLTRDYVGMVRFHLMLKQNLITSPITTNLNLGVTNSEDTLNIGESIFEITKLPDFNMNLDTWRALPRMKDFNVD